MSCTITPARTTADYTIASTLFHAYASSPGLDLTFQSFTNELANLQDMYSPPGGVLLLAKLESTNDNGAVGCVGVWALDPSMKRLYVRPEGRGKGIGKALALRAMLEAKRLGYVKMCTRVVSKCRVQGNWSVRSQSFGRGGVSRSRSQS
jgi:GNAT superfamily N-acetyltransferase